MSLKNAISGFCPQGEIRPNIDPSTSTKGPITGRFIETDEGEIFLQDHNGNRWALPLIQLASSAFTNTEGVMRYPKTWKYDTDTGDVTQRGDVVLIFFEEAMGNKPIVFGSLRPWDFQTANEAGEQGFPIFKANECERRVTRWASDKREIETIDHADGRMSMRITSFDEDAEEDATTEEKTVSTARLTVTDTGEVLAEVRGEEGKGGKGDVSLEIVGASGADGNLSVDATGHIYLKNNGGEQTLEMDPAGTITIEDKNGNRIQLSGNNIYITSKSKVILNGSTGGIHTSKNHPFCFMTGAPLWGSPTERAKG